MIRYGLRKHLLGKRWRRRSWLVFALVTAFSLGANFISNERPLVVSDARTATTYFPFLEFQSGRVFHQPQDTEADYTSLESDPSFLETGGYVVWAPLKWGAFQSDREVVNPPSPPSLAHPWGTDDRGRDVFSRVLYGYRTSLAFAITATLLVAFLGFWIGAFQGYSGGYVDLIIQRVIESFRSFPILYLLVFAGAVVAPGFWVALLVWATLAWIPFGQYVRAEVLRAREMPYVTAARLLGYGRWRILVRHILPNTLPRLIAYLPFSFFASLITLAAVDFLGVGLAPPAASLGEMIHQVMENRHAWWLLVFPGLVLAGLLFFTQMIAEVLREALEDAI